MLNVHRCTNNLLIIGFDFGINFIVFYTLLLILKNIELKGKTKLRNLFYGHQSHNRLKHHYYQQWRIQTWFM